MKITHLKKVDYAICYGSVFMRRDQWYYYDTESLDSIMLASYSEPLKSYSLSSFSSLYPSTTAELETQCG